MNPFLAGKLKKTETYLLRYLLITKSNLVDKSALDYNDGENEES
jgi:hypothetical protein